MLESIISDASTIIALEKIDSLPLLCQIYSEVIIPEAVSNEIGNLSLKCFSIRKVESTFIKLLIENLNLGKGEAEVIALAHLTGLKALIDDLKARKIAENMGLNISGTIGVLLKAEKLGLIESALTKVKDLKDKGFFIPTDLIEDLAKLKK